MTNTTPEAIDIPEAARILRQLVEDHKQISCPGENCTISLMMMLPIYESLVGRKATTEEFRSFI
jgi:hypothetical protein